MMSIIHDGGKVIGKGSYGCIVYPHYPCPKSKSRSRTKKVSKISPPDEEVIQAIYAKLSKIKNHSKYFIFPIENCHIKTKEISKQDIKQCKHLKLYKQPKIINSIMLKGDHNLSETKRIQFRTVIKYIKTLIQSTILLKDNRICHFDIKGLNIIIRNRTPYYIDFDDTFNLTGWNEFKIFIKNFAYMNDTYVWPIEVYSYFDHFSKDIPDYVYSYMEKINWKRYIDKVMVWELGLAFSHIMDKVMNNKKKHKLNELIGLMLIVNPHKRFNLKQCLDFINKI